MKQIKNLLPLNPGNKMNKYLVLVMVLLVAVPYVTTANNLEAKVDSEVFETLDKSETAEVIVVLDDNAKVEVAEEDIRISDNNWKTSDEKIVSSDVEVVQTYSAALNGFAAEVTEEGLQKLEQNENVKRIYHNQMYQIALQTSVPQISASDVHNLQLAGVDLKGAGQAICIIDTGVDYNHADLGGCFGAGCKVVSGYDFCADGANCITEDADPMDENGHGTHVAGIAVATGTITGVAPEANLIAIKVFNDSGSTSAWHIISGIDWCVANATEFNISAITMSLSLLNISNGEEVIFTSNSVCDDYSDGGVVNASNNAAAQGILVAVAAGNKGDTTGIGSPACGSNVTSVGAVDSSDAIHYNRGPILDLLAPGKNINSTYISDGYYTKSGTSMAVPHVAGAAAILFQIAELEGANVTVQQVEDALKENGEDIYDDDSDYTYPRIDVLAAANSFIYPTLTYTGTAEDGSAISTGTTLNFTAEDISGVDDFWYDAGAGDSTDFVYSTSETEWAVDANWTEGEYNLTFYANDSVGNTANATLDLIVDTAPAIDDWSWSNSTGSYTSEEIRLDEGDTLHVYIDAIDDDVYNNLTYSWKIDGLENNTEQNFTYLFGLQDAGEYDLSVNVSDEYLSTVQEWSLIVDDPQPPVWNANISDKTADEENWIYSIASFVTNPDEDVLTYLISSGFSISAEGVISRTFDCDDEGEEFENVVATVSDGTTPVDSNSFNVTVSDDLCASDGGDGDDDEDDDEDSGGSEDEEESFADKSKAGVVKKAAPKTTAAATGRGNATTESENTTEKDTSFGLAGRFADLDISLTENQREVGIGVAVLSASCLGYGFWRRKLRTGKNLDITGLGGYFKKK